MSYSAVTMAQRMLLYGLYCEQGLGFSENCLYEKIKQGFWNVRSTKLMAYFSYYLHISPIYAIILMNSDFCGGYSKSTWKDGANKFGVTLMESPKEIEVFNEVIKNNAWPEAGYLRKACQKTRKNAHMQLMYKNANYERLKKFECRKNDAGLPTLEFMNRNKNIYNAPLERIFVDAWILKKEAQ